MFDTEVNSGFTSDADINVSGGFSEIALLHQSANGYSQVYKAKRYGIWHTLKGLTKEAASQVQYRTLLEKEFRIAYPLSHPNIVRTIGMEEVEGLGWCIVQEYIDSDCAKRLTKEQASELCDALIYLHGLGIVHRDIKLDNILVRRDNGRVVLIDFGLADKPDYAVLKGAAGTSGYVAPEVLAGEDVSPLNDVYSLGVVLSETTGMKKIAARCMDKNPRKRYASVSEVKRAIERKRPWLAVSLAVLAVVFGCGLYALYWEYHNLDTHQTQRTDNMLADVDSLNSLLKARKDSLDATLAQVNEIKAVNESNVAKFDSLQRAYNLQSSQTNEIIQNYNNQINDLKRTNYLLEEKLKQIEEEWEDRKRGRPIGIESQLIELLHPRSNVLSNDYCMY